MDHPVSDEQPQTPEHKPVEASTEASAPPPVEEKPPWLSNPATPEWQEAGTDPLVEGLSGHQGAIVQARTFAGDLVVEIVSDKIAEVCTELKQQGFIMLVDLCGVDYPDREVRFEVVYHLYSFDQNRRIQLKVLVADGNEVPTVSSVWRAANWMEREAFDMYGIRFTDHPDMTRILTWEGFNGYPLRKDFPVEGIDTGAAAYPEYYLNEAGPVAGTGTGWKPPQPLEPESKEDAAEGTES